MKIPPTLTGIEESVRERRPKALPIYDILHTLINIVTGEIFNGPDTINPFLSTERNSSGLADKYFPICNKSDATESFIEKHY